MKQFAVALFNHHTGEIAQSIRYGKNEHDVLEAMYVEKFGEAPPLGRSVEAIYESFFDCDCVLSVLEIT